MSASFHQQYLALVEEIERRFPVSEWKSGDVDIWPLARMDLYLDMYGQTIGDPNAGRLPRPLRVLEQIYRPVSNIWKQRYDMRRHLLRPRPAKAIFLGDGVSLDRIDDAWEDRYCEPLIAALEAEGIGSFLMQAGDMRRVPWRRPTFAANSVEAAGHVLAPFFLEPLSLPNCAALAQFLQRQDVCAPSLSPEKLARRAATVRATAHVFERILRTVKPRLAFTVTWYAGLGPAFLLACRRQGILSVDLQHCPQGGRHKAYCWSAIPERGYGLLPAIFWNWNEADTAQIASWTGGPWHRGLYGGHTRLAPFLDDADPRTLHWDAKFRQVGGGEAFEREILVALQTIGGQGRVLNALADEIAAAPPNWRWWIRRHPAARPQEDILYAKLLSLRGPNIRIEEASSLPLPALLRHMTVVVSISSGVAAEATPLGIPAIFLSSDARGSFGYLIESGHARIADDISKIQAAIAALPRIPSRPPARRQPDVSATLIRLSGMANDYARLCAGT
ncbi:MAG: hypothetical protein JWM91_1082 [Rhodospirillales bacterium]|nr:hypothetical protein [Rhodospirillales bacterium]